MPIKLYTYRLLRFIGAIALISCCIQEASAQYILSDSSRATVIGIGDLPADEFRTISTSYDSVDKPQVESIKVNFVSGELVVDYTLNNPLFKKEQQDHKYYATIEVLHGGQELFIRPDKVIGSAFDNVGAYSGQKRLVVTRFFEDHVELDDTLSVILTVVHSFDLNEFPLCAEGEPEWGFQQKVPFIMGAIGGAGLIAAGAVLEANAQDTYDDYKRSVERTQGEMLYEEANKRHKWAQGLILGGIGVIAADVTWYLVRHKRFKRKKYMFETYCPNAQGNVGIDPYVHFGDFAQVSPQSIGVRMTYTFDK